MTVDRITPEALRGDIAAALGLPAVAVVDDEPLVDLGLDSIRLMSLLQHWRNCGADVDFSQLAERPTLREWIELICHRTRDAQP